MANSKLCYKEFMQIIYVMYNYKIVSNSVKEIHCPCLVV